MAKRERLDKVLGNLGVGTRKEIKDYCKKGRIRVNGEIEKDSSAHVNPEEDTFMFDGVEVEYKKYLYLMMHKPQGVLSATKDGRTRTVIDILEPEDKVFEPFPVGRLDIDTEGLLLLTDDGQMAHRLLSPKKHVDKIYLAHVDGSLSEEDIKAFAEGITFLDDGYKCLPAELEIVESKEDESKALVTIREGKYHQVKRMFEARNRTVTYLKRLSMGTLQLDEDLELGQYRELTDEEIKELKELTKMED